MKHYHYLYGPVPSRRLGRSLGIDLVPHKICTYNCIYCQIGRTTEKSLVRKEYLPIEEVLKEVKHFLENEASPIDYLSLSGSGEPTLHSQIGRVIDQIKEITSLPVAVITNGSLFYEREVRQDLIQADVVLPSLDAVSPEIFRRINRPYAGLSIEDVIKGLVEFRRMYRGRIWLEILFCKGVNDSLEELQKMKEVIQRIQPDLIHLNTVVRPPSEDWVSPLSLREMEKIKNFFGEKALIISEFNRHPFRVSEKEFKERILRTLRRRPLSISDLSKGMEISQDELTQYLKVLIREGKIRSRVFGDSIYYEIK